MSMISKLLLTGGVLIAAKGVDSRLEVTHYNVRSSKIPKEFDGYKIVHVSDSHNEHIPGLMNEISIEKPDIIVSTGDMVNDYGEITPAVRFTRQLAETAPLYMVTGNHDIWRSDFRALISSCEKAGGIFLRNETIELEKDGAKIALSGIDDPYSRTASQIRIRLAKSISAIRHYDGFHIVLFHRANLLDYFKDKGFDLVLAGHMHGGQLRLPIMGGVLSPKTGIASGGKLLFPKYFGGVYQEGHTQMIVSRGLGNPMIIPRLFNRPELVVITLKHKENKENNAPSE